MTNDSGGNWSEERDMSEKKIQMCKLSIKVITESLILPQKSILLLNSVFEITEIVNIGTPMSKTLFEKP